jgi:hypothetical protein
MNIGMALEYSDLAVSLVLGIVVTVAIINIPIVQNFRLPNEEKEEELPEQQMSEEEFEKISQNPKLKSFFGIEEKQIQQRNEKNLKAKDDEISSQKITDELLEKITRNPKLKSLLGIQEDQMLITTNDERKDIDIPDETTEEKPITEKKNKTEKFTNWKASVSNQLQEDLDDSDGILCRWLITIVMIFGGIYAINIATNGEIGRMIAGFFPVETEALKIKHLLEKL